MFCRLRVNCQTEAKTMACSAAKVFKQTSVFTVNSAAANNESLWAGDVLGPDEDVLDCFEADGLRATSDDDQYSTWGPWSTGYGSDDALSRRQRDRCLSHGTRYSRWAA